MRQKKKLRVLSEARAVRLLSAGGMVVETGGVHLVYRHADRRAGAIGSLAPHIVRRLEGLGHLVLQASYPPRRTRAGPPPLARAELRAVAPPVSLLVIACRGSRESLLVRVLRLQTDRNLRVRLWSAAQRFNGDVERAATPASITMRWDALPVSRQRAGPGDDGRGASAAAALGQLAALEAALGLATMRDLEALLVQHLQLAGFAHAFDLSTEHAERRATEALIALADAYDQLVRSNE